MGFWKNVFKKKGSKKLVEDRQQTEKNGSQKRNDRNPIIENYIKGLKSAYLKSTEKEEWDFFERIIHGAKKEDLNKLKRSYPEIPDTFINLLEYVDGTYWRKYGINEITFFLLGSDIQEYPYYLLSTKEIIKNRNQAKEYFSEYIERKYDEVEVDDRIIDNSESIRWLHFSDCMNNGGTSQLYIDFSPSKKGVKGQVVRYLHDPDELIVIADSFDQYLSLIIEKKL